MTPKVTTIGSATRDIFIVPEKIQTINNQKDITQKKLMAFELGAKLNALYLRSLIGGTAINIAIGLKRLGIDTTVRCTIGKDTAGKSIIKKLKREGINTDLINIAPNNKTDRSLIIIDPQTRERTIFVNKEARRGIKVDYSKISSECIYVSSIKYNWEIIFKRIEEMVKIKKTRLFFTPGIKQVKAGTEKLKSFLKKTEIIFLNEDEALEFSRIKNDKLYKSLKKNHEKLINHVAKKIYSYGPQIVVITAGEKGAYVFNKNKIIFYQAIKTNVADITGAGDAFASGFLAHYLKKRSLKTAALMGIQNSSSVIKNIGTTKGLLKNSQLIESN